MGNFLLSRAMQVIKSNRSIRLTRTCWGSALNPKSETFRVPFASKSKFSGCNQKVCNWIQHIIHKNRKRNNNNNNNISSNLKVSMINTSAMAIVHCINKLLKVLPRLIFLQSPSAWLIIHTKFHRIKSLYFKKKKKCSTKRKSLQFYQKALHQ